MKRFLMLGLIVSALATMGVSAEAGHRHHWGRHIFHGGFFGRSPILHNSWHNTSHYDYHPGQFTRHRNHFHYQPGHYDWHRTGHWDTHLHH